MTNGFEKLFFACMITLLVTTGCANMNHAQSGALVGTGMGALAGAAIGDANGNAGAGALIGGITGAMAGSIIGGAEDARVERDQALFERDIAYAQAQANQPAPLSNFDLLRLGQSGVSDDIIVNMIQNRGGDFDLSTESIIALKNQGVSDRVILAAQNAPRIPSSVVTPVSHPGVVVLHQPAPAFIVESRPPPFVFHHHHHRRHRSGAHLHFNF